MNQLLRVQNFNVSRDGFGAGENQSLERPFGHANPGEMFAWAGAKVTGYSSSTISATSGAERRLSRCHHHLLLRPRKPPGPEP